ncbi:MAG: NfeD family protein [Burkholderiaceae bacterium]
MQLHYWWWIVAVGLGVLELITGTFYLLVLALACAAGGLAAWAGAGMPLQLLATAAVAVIGWLLLRRRNPWRAKSSSSADRDMLLDIGERLRVEAWEPGGQTRVQYRGASWTAELDPSQPADAAQPGTFVIVRVVGNRLIVRSAP